ncbi:MAG: aminotransferase class V-fold PLP-dependent enzyme [Christensenellaceae bacterium]
MKNIYLDNAATTKPLDELKKVYEAYQNKLWQNPSALYAPAVLVQNELNRAKEVLLAGFQTHKCFFTSCGSEGANTVILKGMRQKKNMNFVCGGAEHPCVEESFKALEALGHQVTYIKTNRSGLIAAEDVIEAVNEDTALVSMMHVNNETGAKNDIEAIAAAVKAKNNETLFHADGVQAFLKNPLTDTSNIDYYTVSAHKLHAHKGTGAVIYKDNTPLKPYILGGGQEGGQRSGTQNMLGILSFAKAVQILRVQADFEQVYRLKEAFLEACSTISDCFVISPLEKEKACGHIVNISLLGVNGETLLHMLEAQGIYISTGSACSSKKGKSRIAKALGLTQEQASGAVRISFSPFTTVEEVTEAAEEIAKSAAVLRKFKRK